MSRRGLAGGTAALVLVVAGGAAAGRKSLDPPLPVALASVRLTPVPGRVVARCRSIQRRARVPILCPTLVPRAFTGGIPPGGHPATLGGKHGLLVPAREGSFYGNGLYWGNHVRFLWRERGVPYVATLHTFGELATERLLGRLVRSLRPVDAMTAPARRGLPLGTTPNAFAIG